MSGGYLRVKNWARFQHYSKRQPPWIKLYNDLIGAGDDFGHLGELEQWQLVRIWMEASKSSKFTLDESGRVVPVIPNDEQAIRRAIQTLKRVPLAKFVQEGRLIVVDASALLANDASAGASALLDTEVESKRVGEERHLKAVLDGSETAAVGLTVARIQALAKDTVKDMPA